MPTPSTPDERAKSSTPLMHEADIGSGERTPAQEETEEMIRQIPPLPERQQSQQQQQQQQQQQKPGGK